MPTKYAERLQLPTEGIPNIELSTNIGLSIASGYDRVVYSQKKPYLEFSESQLEMENIYIPENQKWRIQNSSSPYIEYRSKDCYSVKIIKQKDVPHPDFVSGKFYISPFDLKSKKIPVLISPLLRKRTLASLSS